MMAWASLPGMPTPDLAPTRDRPAGVRTPRAAGVDPRMGRILLATDLSTASRAATAAAVALAAEQHARLIVLSVVDPRLLRLPGGRFRRRVDQERADVEAGVQSVVASARAAGIAATFLVWVGEPAEAILEAAEAEDADVIVMGSHGRGRVGRLLRGSTSTRVSATSTRPVRVIQS
jgi:nucleotide-binding universal stress UspA family protein